MLLEAGYLEQAIERLEDAIAINPNVRTARWEVARAYALEQRWEDNERLVAQLSEMGVDRPVLRARFAWWRRDIPALLAVREKVFSAQQMFVPGMMGEFISVYVEGDWTRRRRTLIDLSNAMPPNPRRRSFVGQLIAEAAGFSGDVETALERIEFAINEGLFDLHWLDRCPLLDDVRAAPEFSALRARVKLRADAILDALYGDHHLGTSETAVASGY
jgi:serine/threonine-protein kinase